MKARNVSTATLEQAAAASGVRLIEVRQESNSKSSVGYTVQFRLGLLPSKKWQRLNHTLTRKVNAVCWHGHKAFMQELFKLAPEAWLDTSMAKYRGKAEFERLYPDTQYLQRGPMMEPQQYGEMCTCAEREIAEEDTKHRLQTGPVTMLKQSDIGECPFYIMLAEHYNKDGSCKCHDAQYREMMKREWEYTDADFKAKGLI